MQVACRRPYFRLPAYISLIYSSPALYYTSFYALPPPSTPHAISQYDAGKLGESNKDALDNDLLGLIKSSSDKLLTHLFRKQEVQDSSAGSGKGSGSGNAPSAGTRIRHQCALLVTALMECSPHYVRWYVFLIVFLVVGVYWDL